MIIDAKVETEPIAWLVSKIKRLSNGLNRITLAQDKFDQFKDYVEKDESGRIIGMWADYFSQLPQVQTEILPSYYSSITFTGKPQLKVKGGYKKVTVNFFNNKEEISHLPGNWKFEIKTDPGTPTESINSTIDLVHVITPENTSDLTENQIKVKFLGDDSYLNSILIVSYVSDTGIKSSAEFKITGL